MPHPGGKEQEKRGGRKKEKLRMLKQEEEGGEGGQTQEAAGNPPVCIQSASEGRSVSVCWKRWELREGVQEEEERRW